MIRLVHLFVGDGCTKNCDEYLREKDEWFRDWGCAFWDETRCRTWGYGRPLYITKIMDSRKTISYSTGSTSHEGGAQSPSEIYMRRL
ncbi:hypothetical protein GJ744_008792 [Endocarpon pusillum]|uniref:Uncharacterized protein n=1 Tax=Endocarpon pusillum TaxID=364733 RepID=A0A8H7AQP9_9EURO|nr:hypothetical protein GJ744_008792 [Endocarpon pusillum]